jgi:hypothetical protein
MMLVSSFISSLLLILSTTFLVFKEDVPYPLETKKRNPLTHFHVSGDSVFNPKRQSYNVMFPFHEEHSIYNAKSKYSDFQITLLTATSHPLGQCLLQFSSLVTAAGP